MLFTYKVHCDKDPEQLRSYVMGRNRFPYFVAGPMMGRHHLQFVESSQAKGRFRLVLKGPRAEMIRSFAPGGKGWINDTHEGACLFLKFTLPPIAYFGLGLMGLLLGFGIFSFARSGAWAPVVFMILAVIPLMILGLTLFFHLFCRFLIIGPMRMVLKPKSEGDE